MCGILGVAGQVAAYRVAFPYALSQLAHRGPDGHGLFNDGNVMFGHRRLAIIDLSAGGHQPMTDLDTGMAITFNGEIYNYIEIRSLLAQQGVKFRTDSDTEVLLRAWIHWREKMFDRLNGMWAFAIWDPRSQELILSRDRFGVKPLYWARSNGNLMFASEPKALFALDANLARPCADAIWRFMADSRSHEGGHSFYEQVKAFQPASFARVKLSTLEVVEQRYWDYPVASDTKLEPEEARRQFSDLLEDAVRLRLRSDVPVGLTLSGGLDSSALLAAAKFGSGSSLHSYTSVYSADLRGEEQWAKKAALGTGSSLTSVEAGSVDWLATLEQIVWHMDGPGFSPAVFPLWEIMRKARADRVPVLLEGQGADELLGGYPQYAALSVLSGKAGIAERLRAFRKLVQSAGLKWSLLWLARLGAAPLAKRYGPRAERVRMLKAGGPGEAASPAPPADLEDRMLLALHHDHSASILPPLLQYGDAISMAHGVESRLPFMDYRLVEWVYRNQPPLIADGLTKLPLRQYLSANGMQVIAQRTDKLGYPTPLVNWLQTEGSLTIMDLLRNPEEPVWTYLRPDRVQRLYQSVSRGGVAAAFHMYKILTLAIWLRQLATVQVKSREGSVELLQMLSEA